MGSRIREWADHVEKLHNRARPTVREDQRYRSWLRRPHMQKVHVGAVDLRCELRKLVQFGLGDAPVVGRAPIVGKLTQIAEWNAVTPAHHYQIDSMLSKCKRCHAARPRATP